MTLPLSLLPFCGAAALVCLACAVPAEEPAARPAKAADAEKVWVYVGTYTGPKSKGIYRLELDSVTGKLTLAGLAAETKNPSFLAIHPSKKFLYAVNEVGDYGPKKTGAVSAFAIDAASGKLTPLNQESSGGAAPCHLVVDKEGKHVLAANYTGGSVCVLPLTPDGKLGAATAFVQHTGKSVNPARQKEPHAHSINLDAANRFAFAADLGLDKILVYRYDAAKGALAANDPPAFATAPGAGPRHFAFHPDGKHAYVIDELDNTITVMDYDAAKGVLTKRQTISTLPKDFKGDNSTAEVQVHPSGKFVYGSNRGHNSIAIFTVDPKTGALTAGGHQGTNIKTPRNFGIDPTGRWMLVANQDGHRVIVFRIDPMTGRLEPTESSVEVGSPVCVKMMAAPSGASRKEP